MKDNKKITKYTSQYMALGMCLGMCMGTAIGSGMDNIGVGMCLGMSVGMCLGLVFGSSKDKKLAENLVEIVAIEETEGSDEVTVRVLDKNGGEKSYTMKKKTVLSEKLAVGDTAADDNGTLVSIKE